ncbi:hypothetical protein MPL3365_450007 [Mesorhizobium plurifarium]|uniref:Uncharacterized protein n=1 Tax=Mesorhizobium plurifarium TaxID=69974 RepID=A0A090GA84_MESPL|nr:hypothetical protein MPL3365_450007 [Mesorhizobium plurifarium]
MDLSPNGPSIVSKATRLNTGAMFLRGLETRKLGILIAIANFL